MFRNSAKENGLDRTDRQIVALLQQNARRSNREIAALVGIAESTCSTRIRRIETEGIVTGYQAVVDLGALGVGMQAMVQVQLRRHSGDEIGLFWEHVAELPEAINAYHVTGPYDFLVHLVVADADHLRVATSESLLAWPEVERVQTSVVFEHRSSPLPIGE